MNEQKIGCVNHDCDECKAREQQLCKYGNEPVSCTSSPMDCQCAIDAAHEQPAAQDSTCNKTLQAQGKAYPRTCRKCGFGPCVGEIEQQPAAWVGLTDEELYEIGEFKNSHGYVTTAFKRVVRAIEAKLREKNT